MKRDAENGGANERMENAVLREHINDVAAEVARLTATLEGPHSPIEAILDGDVARPAASGTNGASPARTPRTAEVQGHARGPHSHVAGRTPRAAPLPNRHASGAERAATPISLRAGSRR